MARQYVLQGDSSAAKKSSIDFAKELNDQQLAAVTSTPGPALVIAGAGSGKTRTLTYRVAWLLDQGIRPEHVLLLTFTNKAANEMLERVRELVPQDISALWGGTFHSIGNRILRRHAEEIGLTRAFSIMDRDDQKSMITSLIKELKFEPKGTRKFPKTDIIIGILSLCQNTQSSVEDIVDSNYSYFYDFLDEITKLKTAYAKRKLATNSVDFDDLLVKPTELLKSNDELRKLYGGKFKYVLVDEYQDTNTVQGEFIDLIVKDHRSLMVVGDDAQSIYSWRGADMQHILAFPEKYPEAQVFKIEINYRSVPEILNLSNASIRANSYQFEKTLQSAREGGEMIPAVVPVSDPWQQARFVTQRISELTEQGMPLNEIAVLYRAHFQSLEIQLALQQANMEFQITSGLRFFEQAHVKDIAAWLRFLTNRKDEISFKRMLSLLDGVGPATATKLWNSWLKSGAADSENLPESFSDVLKSFSVSPKIQKDWEQFGHVLDELAPGGEFARPSKMIFLVMEGFYDEYMRNTFDNYDQRRQDVEQFIVFSEKFDDIIDFLGQMSLLTNSDNETEQRHQKADKNAPKITLSSIHQAKGLEWKVVFLIWLTDGQFPNSRVLDSGDLPSIEEERRLFYVAITRAKDQLYLTYPLTNPKSYTGEVFQQPSRFLIDCPSDLIEMWNIN